MTFTELVAEMERRFPQGNYEVAVEFVQSRNDLARCEHDPKTKRTLIWKASAPGLAKYSTAVGTGDTPEEALRALQSKLALPAEPKLETVDAKAEKPDDVPF